MIGWSDLSVYLRTRLTAGTLPKHSLRMTGVFHKTRQTYC